MLNSKITQLSSWQFSYLLDTRNSKYVLMKEFFELFKSQKYINSIAIPANLTAIFLAMLSKNFISWIFFNSLNAEFFFLFSKGKILGSIIISVLVNPISTRGGRFGHQILNIYVNKTWFRIYSTFMHDDISPLIFDSF